MSEDVFEGNLLNTQGDNTQDQSGWADDALKNLIELSPDTAKEYISRAIDSASSPEEQQRIYYRFLTEIYGNKIGLDSADSGYLSYDEIKDKVSKWNEKTDEKNIFEQMYNEIKYQKNAVYLGMAQYADMQNSTPETRAAVEKWKKKTGDSPLRSKNKLKASLVGGAGLISQMVTTSIEDFNLMAAYDNAGYDPIEARYFIAPFSKLVSSDVVGNLPPAVMHQLEAANAYEEMKNFEDDNGNKLDPKIAKKAADVIGYVNFLIEDMQWGTLGESLGLSKVASTGIKKAASKGMTNALITGLAGNAVMRVVAKSVGGVIEETAQEATQEMVTVLGEEIAKSINNERSGSNIDAVTAQEVSERMKNVITDSASAFAALGLMRGVAGGYRADFHEAQEAIAHDKVKAHEQNIAIENEVKKASIDEQRMKEAVSSDLKIPAEGRAIQYTESGNVFTQTITPEQVNNEMTQARALAGNPKTGENYGYANYTIEGDIITVDNISVKKNITKSEDIRKALILEIAKNNPGSEIVFSTKNEKIQASIDELTKDNPRGSEYGVQWYAEEDKDNVDNVTNFAQFQKKMEQVFKHVEKNKIDVVSFLVQKRAEKLGISPDEYIQNRFSPEAFTSDMPEEVSQKAKEKNYNTRGIRGSTVFQDSRALIYAAENADYRTLQHEMMHAFFQEARDTGGVDYENFKKAFSVENDNWTEKDLEKVASAWEDYLESGSTKSPEIKNVLMKVIDWMRSVYKELRNKIQMKPEIIKAFDDLFSKNNMNEQEEIIEEGNQNIQNTENNYKENNTYLQATEEALLDIANESKDWREFMGRCEAFGEIDITENMSQEEKDAFYQDEYNRLMELNKTTENIDAKGANDIFKERIKNDGLNGFLKKIGEVLTSTRIKPQDEIESQYINALQEKEARIRRQMHPTIIAASLRAIGDKTISREMLSRVKTLMTKKGALSFYRQWYGELMEDDRLRNVEEENANVNIQDIKNDTGGRATIEERIRLSNKIADKELAAKVKSGEIVIDAEMKDYIERMSVEEKNLNNEIESLNSKLSEQSASMTEEEKQYYQLYDEWKKANDKQKEFQLKIDDLTEKGKSIGEALLSARQEAKLQSKNLKQEMKVALKNVKDQARIQQREAIDKRLSEYKQRQAEIAKRKKDIKTIRAYKIKLANKIMKNPSVALVAYDRAEEIRAIQKLVYPGFRQAIVVWKGKKYKLSDIGSYSELLNDLGFEKKIKERLEKKDLSQWSIEELEEMVNKISDLTELGKKELKEKKEIDFKRRAGEARSVSSQVLKAEKYKTPEMAGSIQRSTQLSRLDNFIMTIRLATYNMSRIAQIVDGGEKGANYKLLVSEYRDHNNNKATNVFQRMQKLSQSIKENKLNTRDFYKKITIDGIGPENKSATITLSDLAYMSIGLDDSKTKESILYGNCMSLAERNGEPNARLELAIDKEKKIREAISKYITPQMQNVIDVIRNDFRDNYDRLNRVFIDEHNVASEQVDNYVPKITQDVTGSRKHEKEAVKEMLNVNGISIQRNPKEGFMVKRIDISPEHQRPIRLDLLSVYAAAVDRQEHLIAFSKYVRDLNYVYKGKNDFSTTVSDAIVNSYGAGTKKYIEKRINEIANPDSFTELTESDKIMQVFRGRMGSAALGYKLSSMVTQAVTSPMPYLAYVSPLDMTKSAYGLITNYDDFVKTVNQSTVMRDRVMSPIIDAIEKSVAKNKAEEVLNSVNAFGMEGLKAIDWVSVSVGWKAVYDKEYAFLSKDNKYSENEINRRSIQKADDVTLECQPSGDIADLSPLFKGGNEFTKMFTQFGAGLNVIWQQITYDMTTALGKSFNTKIPKAIRFKSFQYAVRLGASYAMAGIMLGLIKNSGDNDDDGKLDDIAFWSLSQATDSVPLVGNYVTAAWKKVATGELGYEGSNARMSFIEELYSGFKHVTNEDYDKAIESFLEASGYLTGLPVAGTKEAIRAGEEGLGALVGRREDK